MHHGEVSVARSLSIPRRAVLKRLIHTPGSGRAASTSLSVVVAEEWLLDGPEGLTDETTTQNRSQRQPNFERETEG